MRSSGDRGLVTHGLVARPGCGARPGRSAPVQVMAVLLVVGLAGTACGARVGPYLGAGATSAAGSTSQSTTPSPAGTGSSTGATSTSSGSATGTDTGSAGTGASKSPSSPQVAPPSQFSFTPQAEAAACPGTTGNTANPLQGISTSAIQIGNVSGLSGPLSGSFPQGPEAVTALFDAVNAAGGICGRALDLTVEDDGQNATTDESDVENLIDKPVFAFAGSTSDADSGGVPEIEQADVPDFGFAINCDRSEEPQYWSVAGGSCDQDSSGTYYIGDDNFMNAQQNGYLPKKMAFLAYSIAISAQAAQQYEYVYEHDFGGDVCYSDFSVSPFNVNLEPDVEQMQADGCQGVLDTLDVTGNASLLQAMQQQNFTMPYVAATFDAYTPEMIATAGESAAQGLLVTIPFIPLNESNPMDVMYEQQLSQYEPGDQPSGFGFLAWLAAQMMIYALLQQRNPTRASVTSFLDSLQNYTAGGAVGPHAPADHAANVCDMDVVVKGDDFVRRSPASGLFCSGQEVVASS